MVAPAYIEDNYVDHELSANLDSTFAFEGPEKLLELWFWPDEKSVPGEVNREGLRSIQLDDWVKILDLVSCKILSMKSSKYVDAYLLSESSLFVFPHKLILKTCGTTTTLACLEDLFDLVKRYLGAEQDKLSSKEIFKVFYSRRSFMFPNKQRHVHRDWKHEVKLLNEFFVNGKSYIVGDCTSDDHWYLYMGGKDGSGLPISENPVSIDHHDQTFEILMTDLNPVKAKNFFTSRKPGAESLVENDENSEEDSDLGHDIGVETMQRTGLDSIFVKGDAPQDQTNQLPSPSLSDSMEYDEDVIEGKPDVAAAEAKCTDKLEFLHDAFSFSPCGFSSNSVSVNNGGFYYTLHITPESGWSYASFETNYPFSKSRDVTIMEVLLRVLAIFEPGKFSMTLIHDNSQFKSGDEGNRLTHCDQLLRKLGYRKHEKIIYDLKSEYNLLYLNFEKI